MAGFSLGLLHVAARDVQTSKTRRLRRSKNSRDVQKFVQYPDKILLKLCQRLDRLFVNTMCRETTSLFAKPFHGKITSHVNTTFAVVL